MRTIRLLIVTDRAGNVFRHPPGGRSVPPRQSLAGSAAGMALLQTQWRRCGQVRERLRRRQRQLPRQEIRRRRQAHHSMGKPRPGRRAVQYDSQRQGGRLGDRLCLRHRFSQGAIQSNPEVHSLRAVPWEAGEEDAGRRQVKLPIDLATDNKGNILVLAVDYRPQTNLTYGVRIEKYSQDGVFISQWGAEAGSGDGQLQRPNAIAVDAEGNIYITEIVNGRVQKFDSSGKFLTKWGTSWAVSREGDGLFRGGARSIAIDKAGDLCVLDFNSVQKFTPAGKFLARWKTSGDQARRFAVDSHSNIYVTYENSHAVMKLDPNGNVVSQWGCAGDGDGLFSLPGSIAVNPSGHMFVADLWN